MNRLIGRRRRKRRGDGVRDAACALGGRVEPAALLKPFFGMVGVLGHVKFAVVVMILVRRPAAIPNALVIAEDAVIPRITGAFVLVLPSDVGAMNLVNERTLVWEKDRAGVGQLINPNSDPFCHLCELAFFFRSGKRFATILLNRSFGSDERFLWGSRGSRPCGRISRRNIWHAVRRVELARGSWRRLGC